MNNTTPKPAPQVLPSNYYLVIPIWHSKNGHHPECICPGCKLTKKNP